MYHEFLILEVKTDLKNKRINIITNNKIDPNSVDEIVLDLTERATGTKIDYKLNIIDQTLEIELSQWPVPNSLYVLYLKDLKNVLGTSIKSGLRRKITFDSEITDKAVILTPAMHETVESLNIEFDIINNTDITDPNFSKLNQFIKLEISDDNAFYDIIKSSEIHTTSITIDDLKSGQLFLRARVESNDNNKFQYGDWSKTISFIYKKPECEDCKAPEIEEPDFIPGYEDMSPVIEEEDLELNLLTPKCFTPEEVVFVANKELDEDSMFSSRIFITSNNSFIKSQIIISGNILTIVPDESTPFKDNSIYTIKILNLKSKDGELLTADYKIVTKMTPLYTTVEEVIALIGDYNIDEDIILMNIRSGSKFADYILSVVGGGKIDEEDIPFEVEQLVKYYAAHECLLRYSIDMASTVGVKGAVGNVSFEDRETTKDISMLLKHFCNEIEKWKDEVKGYKLEGRAKMQSGVRGAKANPAFNSIGLKDMANLGRGDM